MGRIKSYLLVKSTSIPMCWQLEIESRADMQTKPVSSQVPGNISG